MNKWILALGLLGLPLSGLQAEEPLLKNPGFESGTEGWKIGEKEPMFFILPEAARRGSKGLRVEDKSTQAGGSIMSDPIPVKGGQKVKLVFWARSADEKSIAVKIVYFMNNKEWTTDGRERLPEIAIKNTGTKWEKYELEAVVPDQANALGIWVYTWGQAIGKADFDDFEIKIK